MHRDPGQARAILQKHPLGRNLGGVGAVDPIVQGVLDVSTPVFLLRGREFQIISGAVHYFRVPPLYWGDRLQKARAMGLNTVETYVPWNFHEPRRGEFDFASPWRDITRFVRLAAREGLQVIVRPSPFICAEWEWGGHPSWLLEDEDMEVGWCSAAPSPIPRYRSIPFLTPSPHMHHCRPNACCFSWPSLPIGAYHTASGACSQF